MIYPGLALLRRIQILLCAVCLGLSATQNVMAHEHDAAVRKITRGQTLEGTFERAGRQLFALPQVQRGDFVSGWVDQHDISFRLELLPPSGKSVRAWQGLSRGKFKFSFVAEDPGPYRLALTTTESGRGAYALSVEKVAPAHGISGAAEGQPSSARLRSLQANLAAGKTTLGEFWSAVAQEGTPLVEKLDDDSFRVTFLWRGGADTHEVRLVWVLPPFEKHLLTQLPGTDVWYRSETLPRGARFTYQLAPDPPDEPGGVQAVAEADPLNAHHYGGVTDTDKYSWNSLTELPGAASQPWAQLHPGVRQGRVEKSRLMSRVLGNDREVAVYVPADYRPDMSEGYGLLIVFDEEAYLDRVPTPVILDNLIGARQIEPTVAVLVGNSSEEGRLRELAPNEKLAAFMAEELLPWIRARYHVTEDPTRVIIAGSSFGGLAAGYVAFEHPELFGNVLAQSGSFWWSPTRNPADPAHFNRYSEPAWLVRQFATSPKLPLTFYMDAGWFEGGEGGGILDTNRFFRDVLLAKGYTVRFQEFIGGHDYVNWRGTLADGLLALAAKRPR